MIQRCIEPQILDPRISTGKGIYTAENNPAEPQKKELISDERAPNKGGTTKSYLDIVLPTGNIGSDPQSLIEIALTRVSSLANYGISLAKPISNLVARVIAVLSMFALVGTLQSTEKEEEEENEPRGVIYARVSSDKQAQEGESLEEQVRSLKSLAESEGIKLIDDPFVDSGETGTNFDREGIYKVEEKAALGEIDHLLVDDLDRIGRIAPDVVYLIWSLRRDFDVTIVTNASGEVDVDTMSGLASTFIHVFSSHFQNENRSRRANEARYSLFKQKKWESIKKSTPIGYELSDKGWPTTTEKDAERIRIALWRFLMADISKPYKLVSETLDKWYSDVNGTKAKSLLQNPILIGKPTAGGKDGSFHETRGDGVTVIDPDLQIVSTELFARVQRKIERVSQRHTTSSETQDIEDLVIEYGFAPLYNVLDCVKLVCPRNTCSGKLVKNGIRSTAGKKVHNYVCTEADCPVQGKIPTSKQLRRLQSQTAKALDK